MTDRLSPADVAFLYLESRATPQHVGGVAVFESPVGGLDHARLVRLIEERISLVPRYRQKLREVPGGLANPVWIDDPAFDISYHVRRSALPRPGDRVALLDFVARIQSRLLDRSRPLWEMYLVEGLTDGQVAVVTKTHPSMVDGVSAVDIAQVLLDASPEPRRTVAALWMPATEPTARQLLADAALDVARRPAAVVDVVRLSVRDARSTVGWAGEVVGSVAGIVSGVLASAVPASLPGLRRAAHPSPLVAGPGEHRRIATVRAELDDLRAVRAALGGTVNDAVLATVSGALRAWLLSRGEVVRPSSVVRAMVPMSVAGDAFAADRQRSGRVRGVLVELPVGADSPLARLDGVRTAMAGHSASGVGADSLVALSGFAPPTLHALGARAANELTRRGHSLVITNVPGPQWPLYAAGARMSQMYPILPLNKGQALSIALTSYDGGMFFGINADRDAVPDVEVVAGCVSAGLQELVAYARAAGSEAGVSTRRRGRAKDAHRVLPLRNAGDQPVRRR